MPPNAAVLLSCVVPVLPAMSWPGICARRPVPPVTTPTIMLASVFATPGLRASGLQWSPVSIGLPSAPFSGWPVRSRIAVTGVGSQWVPLAATVE